MPQIIGPWLGNTVAALQFWTVDLDAHTLGCVTEQVYSTFFYSPSTHLLCQQSDEILFGYFVTTLNAAFEDLALEDEGYESGNENFNMPTPLRRTTKIHHVSSIVNASFNPNLVTPHRTGSRETHFRPVHRCLTFSSSEEDDNENPADKLPSPDQIPPVL